MKMLALFFLVLFSFSASSQADLLDKIGSKYIYKGKKYKCKELSSIYSQSKEAYKLYNSGKRKKKRARIFAYTGLGLIVSGGIAGILTEDFNIAVIAGGAILLGVVCELIAITPAIRGSYKLRKALKFFNYEMIERHGYQSDPSLSFAVTPNGLGFVYQF